MPLPAEEIQRRLTEFAQKWAAWHGTEKSGAQTFLLQLLACYGTDPADVGAEFEVKVPSGFIDLLWPGVCLIEMKHPDQAKKLTGHYKGQALKYWNEAGSQDRAPAEYVVISSFQRFQVWRPGYTEPETEFDLVELPYRLEALGFLGGLETRFIEDRAELTREAAQLVTTLYGQLNERLTTPDAVRDFVLQAVWCMFAEDLGLLPGRVFSGLVEVLANHPEESSIDVLGQLFHWLNSLSGRPEHGRYSGVPYVDGQLFAAPGVVHLEPSEVALLAQACGYRWNLVEPAIFGSLLEGALGRERQWALGAHYTSEANILQVVGPTIVDPWRRRLAACDTLADVEAALDALAGFRILDPACGSGNFLYVAYRELRRIEAALVERERQLRADAGLPAVARPPVFRLASVHGIELEPFAARLARVTLWMGHALAVHELGLKDEVLPLADLSQIRPGDALRLSWPEVDAIVGNPPYHGSQQIRSELGEQYAEELKALFGIGLKDYAVYWFRKAHERLRAGGGAGFVATNSISQNRNRVPSLEWIAETGGVIVNAVSRQPWPGAAVVNVSIVNWVKQPTEPIAEFVLDGEPVDGITPALRPAGLDVSSAGRLGANAGRAFQGPIPAGAGFILSADEAEELLARSDADYASIVRPYLIGEDIADDPDQAPRRWIIDFAKIPLEEAMKWPAALQIVRKRVKPQRDVANREPNRTFWWQFERPRPEMRSAIAGLSRYIAANAQGKRILFTWQDAVVCPSNLTNVFAFEDDYAMGVLTSRIHGEWARAQSSTLRVDIRYTPTSAFETFPWPAGNRNEVAELAATLIERRQEICADEDIGLTRLYNLVDDGAWQDLGDLHRRLDEAAAAAYGWPRSVAHDPAESNRRLLELNRAISAGELEYDPF
ncbi:MAG: DNA methyltransferase [Gaiellaceae bacterium]